MSKNRLAIQIDNYFIGKGLPCFVVAEAGVNHNGSLETAKRLVDTAISAGADAVKFQTFKTNRLVTHDAPKASYQLKTTDRNESQHEMLGCLELSFEAHSMLFDYCTKQGILFMSTPFDEESANFLAELGVSVFKISSGDLTNLPFLFHVACKDKPMILSTGMANLGEIEAALNTIYETGNRNVAILQCVSNYPSDPKDANLRAMRTMAMAFGIPVGYSDHTQGIEVAIAAAALGACVIEKHFTLDRRMPGPDHQASVEPDELNALVKGIRTVESALGHGRKEPTESEESTAAVARKSLVAARIIPAGTELTGELVAVKRPGTGLPPSMRPYLIGRTTRHTVTAGSLFSLEMLE